MTPPLAPRTRPVKNGLAKTLGLGLAGVSIVGAGLYFSAQRNPGAVPLFAKAPVETPAPKQVASPAPAPAPVTTASIAPPTPARATRPA